MFSSKTNIGEKDLFVGFMDLEELRGRMDRDELRKVPEWYEIKKYPVSCVKNL